MKSLESFVGKYKLTKTIRFELIPVGSTLGNIEKDDLLLEDELLSEEYLYMKKLIDSYHKLFIEECLSDLRLHDLHDFWEIYQKGVKSEKDVKRLNVLKEKMRKQIELKFKSHERYKNLFKEGLIKNELKSIAKNKDDLYIINKFKGFTTYFQGFYENRKNIYQNTENQVSIAHRIVNVNLPIFLDNRIIFQSITENYPEINFNKIHEIFDDHSSDNMI